MKKMTQKSHKPNRKQKMFSIRGIFGYRDTWRRSRGAHKGGAKKVEYKGRRGKRTRCVARDTKYDIPE